MCLYLSLFDVVCVPYIMLSWIRTNLIRYYITLWWWLFNHNMLTLSLVIQILSGTILHRLGTILITSHISLDLQQDVIVRSKHTRPCMLSMAGFSFISLERY